MDITYESTGHKRKLSQAEPSNREPWQTSPFLWLPEVDPRHHMQWSQLPPQPVQPAWPEREGQFVPGRNPPCLSYPDTSNYTPYYPSVQPSYPHLSTDPRGYHPTTGHSPQPQQQLQPSYPIRQYQGTNQNYNLAPSAHQPNPTNHPQSPARPAVHQFSEGGRQDSRLTDPRLSSVEKPSTIDYTIFSMPDGGYMFMSKPSEDGARPQLPEPSVINRYIPGSYEVSQGPDGGYLITARPKNPYPRETQHPSPIVENAHVSGSKVSSKSKKTQGSKENLKGSSKDATQKLTSKGHGVSSAMGEGYEVAMAPKRKGSKVEYMPGAYTVSPSGSPAIPWANSSAIQLPSSPLNLRHDKRSILPPSSNPELLSIPSSLLPGTPPSVNVPLVEPQLCQEQQDLVDLILDGRNVFYTGSAGCGKSTVLKSFVRTLRGRGMQVDIIAPTGRAALDINGSTSWTYAGWTPDSMKKPLKKLKEAAHGKFVKRRLQATDVLVIDEISMMENHHFERLNRIMKEARRTDEAFGGVQLVVTGDFCQLPPVKPFQYCMECGKELRVVIAGTKYKCIQHGEFLDDDKWAFRSQAWEECKFRHVNLTTIHRQNDRVFIDILEKCRMGKRFTEEEENLLLNHECSVKNAVKLFSTREEVRRINLEAFKKLPAKAHAYTCFDDMRVQEQHPHLKMKAQQRDPVDGSLLALRDHRFEPIVELKAGMLVVLLVNMDMNAGLVNGSQGMIVGWDDHKDFQGTEKDIKQAIGKDQGGIAPVNSALPPLTGDYAEMRARNVAKFLSQQPRKAWPIIRFTNNVVRAIPGHCTVNEVGDDMPYSLLSRTQIPLSAAWAMSIHKAQGMTLSRVVVDLSRNFEHSQTYVALSRARDLEGLKVEGLGQWKGGGDETVRDFLRDKLAINVGSE